jgi:NAD(P)-dependent dehydrogenase (short-subunit alcohol dehydrogenase family)
VNLAGTHVLTYTFMPLLLQSAEPRLLFVAGLANQTVAAQKYFPTPDLPAGWPKTVDFETIPYRCSKTALNMLMLDWNHKLKADGVKVWAVGPGFLETDLGGMREMAKVRIFLRFPPSLSCVFPSQLASARDTPGRHDMTCGFFIAIKNHTQNRPPSITHTK